MSCVVKDEELGLGASCDLPEFDTRGVRGAVVLLPVRGSTVESGFGVNLMDQYVAAVAGLDHRVGGDGVAGDDDRIGRQLSNRNPKAYCQAPCDTAKAVTLTFSSL